MASYNRTDIGKDTQNNNILHKLAGNILYTNIINEINITVNCIGIQEALEELIIFFDNDIDSNQKITYLDPIIFDHDGITLLLDQKLKYDKRTLGGQDYYNTWRSAQYLKILATEITQAQQTDCENYIAAGVDLLTFGNWISAKVYFQALSISGIFDQIMKDAFINDATDYITNNY